MMLGEVVLLLLSEGFYTGGEFRMMTKEKALENLASYCSAAEHCIWEVRQKLDRWEIPENDSKTMIAKLVKEGFIDERRYCRAYVNDKNRYNKWGSYKIRYELEKRNIPGDIIQEALSSIQPEENQERLRQLLDAKRKSAKGKSVYEINQKLIRFAMSRGFSIDEINKVL